jgi:hypothetical protein
MKTYGPLAAVLVSIAVSFSAKAQTIDVNVVDQGFETYTFAPGDYAGEGHYPAGTTSGDPIPGWISTSSGDRAGTQNGQVNGLYNGSDSGLQGENFAWDDDTAPFYQILSGPGSTIEAGTYTLTVAVGTRPGATTAGAVLSLYATDGSGLGTDDLKDNAVAGVADGTGTFTDETLSLTIDPGNAAIGQTIAIALAGGNFKGLDNDDFDNVRLTFDPAPEPSAYALMLGGALMLGLMVRRRVSSL